MSSSEGDWVAELADRCLEAADELDGARGPDAPPADEEFIDDILAASEAALVERGAHPLRVALYLRLVARVYVEQSEFDTRDFDAVAERLIGAAMFEDALRADGSPDGDGR